MARQISKDGECCDHPMPRLVDRSDAIMLLIFRCWPGESSYLDFTDARVREWWAEQFALDKYHGKIEIGQMTVIEATTMAL